MSIVDRFICRREGHKPAVILTGSSGMEVSSYTTTCARCGKTIEVEYRKNSGDA